MQIEGVSVKDNKKLNLYAIILIITFTLLVAILSSLALSQIKRTTLEQVKDSLQTVLQTVQEAHHMLIEQRQITVNNIAKTELVETLTVQLLDEYNQQLDLSSSTALAMLRSKLTPVLNDFGDQGFFIIAPDRVSIASMRNNNLGTINLIEKEQKHLLNKAFKGQSLFVPPIRSDVPLSSARVGFETESTMFIMAPIRDAGDNIIAVLALRVNPVSYFTKLTTLGRLGESGETYAFDQEGILLTESRFIEQLRKVNLIDYHEKSSLNVLLKDPGGNLLTGYTPKQNYQDLPYTHMVVQALQGNNGFNIDGYRDYRGVNVLGAWMWDQNYHVGLATEIDQQEALLAYNKTRNTFIIVVSFTFLLGLVLLVILRKAQRHSEKRILRANERLEARVEERTNDLAQAKERLTKLNVELEKLAITDGLTGLYNRRHFDLQFQLEWQRSLRDKKSIAVILFDIDFFKQYNDFYGHLAGDQCITQISEFLLKAGMCNRPSDIIARYGGEEFIMLLSAPTHQYCQMIAQFICDGIRSLDLAHKKTKVSEQNVVTVSVGYALTDKQENSRPSQLLNKADQALYRAKHSGRNRVLEYTSDMNTDNNVTNIFKQ